MRDVATFLTLHEVEHVVQKTSEPRRAAGLGPSPWGTVEGEGVARVDFWARGDAS